MYEAENLEIHTLQNELTQSLGVSAHNIVVAQYFVDARRAVGSGNGQGQHLRQQGLLTVAIVAELDATVNAAMSALRAKIAEIRNMGRMERMGLGMPKRQASLPPPQPRLSFEEVQAEVRALGGYLVYDPNGFGGVMAVNCNAADLSDDARFAMRANSESMVNALRRQAGLM